MQPMSVVVKKIFNSPCVVGCVADVNSGKSMTIYDLLDTARNMGQFDLFTYGLREPIKDSIEIHSTEELETIENSVIWLDEIGGLFDMRNQRERREVENTLRLINHRNNVLILSGTAENFKKFLSAKVDIWLFKKTTIADCVNGSNCKLVLQKYKGYEKGTTLLALAIDEALIYDGEHYNKVKVRYLKQYDTKRNNKPILQTKNKIVSNVETVNTTLFQDVKQ